MEHTYLEQMCLHNRKEVPREGVVVRLDHLDEAEAYKSKSFMFFEWETASLDKGEVDIESEQAGGEDE